MPIQELAPVTLADVDRSLAELESQYEITSADFLNISETNVPDDDAAEWNYLLSQKRALQAHVRRAAVPIVVSNITASARIEGIVYGFTRLTKRSGTAPDDFRPQYDCAA